MGIYGESASSMERAGNAYELLYVKHLPFLITLAFVLILLIIDIKYRNKLKVKADIILLVISSFVYCFLEYNEILF